MFHSIPAVIDRGSTVLGTVDCIEPPVEQVLLVDGFDSLGAGRDVEEDDVGWVDGEPDAVKLVVVEWMLLAVEVV